MALKSLFKVEISQQQCWLSLPCCGSQQWKPLKVRSRSLQLHRECLPRTMLPTARTWITWTHHLPLSQPKTWLPPAISAQRCNGKTLRFFFELQNCPPMVLLVCSKSNENWFQLEMCSFFRDGVFIIWFESKTPDLCLRRTVWPTFTKAWSEMANKNSHKSWHPRTLGMMRSELASSSGFAWCHGWRYLTENGLNHC